MPIENYFEGDLLTKSDNSYNEDFVVDDFSEIQITEGLQSLFQAVVGELKSNVGDLNTSLFYYGSDIPMMIGQTITNNLKEEFKQKVQNVINRYEVILDHEIRKEEWKNGLLKFELKIITVDGNYEDLVEILKRG